MLGYWYVSIQYIHVYAYSHNIDTKCGTLLNPYPQWLIYVNILVLKFTEKSVTIF